MNINIYTNDTCNIVSNDSNVYSNDIDYRIIEFALNSADGDNYNNVELTVNCPTLNDKNKLVYQQEYNYHYIMPNDGIFVYYKLQVYTLDSITDVNNAIYYDTENSKLMYNNIELTDYSIVQELINNKAAGLIDGFYQKLFSICKLKQCLSKLQKQAFFDGLNNCGNNWELACTGYNIDKSKRDFLFISLWILEELICKEKFEEAQDIIDKLSTCSGVCDNLNTNTKNCKCNGKL